jgi:hypothetical protein
MKPRGTAKASSTGKSSSGAEPIFKSNTTVKADTAISITQTNIGTIMTGDADDISACLQNPEFLALVKSNTDKANESSISISNTADGELEISVTRGFRK